MRNGHDYQTAACDSLHVPRAGHGSIELRESTARMPPLLYQFYVAGTSRARIGMKHLRNVPHLHSIHNEQASGTKHGKISRYMKLLNLTSFLE